MLGGGQDNKVEEDRTGVGVFLKLGFNILAKALRNDMLYSLSFNIRLLTCLQGLVKH